ncbi:hypothetical protein TNCV_2648341 [Trichonephila clavipes]|nr:hypothetical protein TNCV_2648341 [Trichonephila clavipes]
MLDRSNEMLDRSNEMLDRSNDMLDRSNDMLDRSNDMLDRSNDMLNRSNDMLDRSNDMLDRSNEIFGERATSFQSRGRFTGNLMHLGGQLIPILVTIHSDASWCEGLTSWRRFTVMHLKEKGRFTGSNLGV